MEKIVWRTISKSNGTDWWPCAMNGLKHCCERFVSNVKTFWQQKVHNFPREPSPVFTIPTIRNFILMSRINVFCCSLRPLLSSHPQWTWRKRNHFFLTRRTPLTTCLQIISIHLRVFQIAMQFSNAIIINAKISMQLLSNCNAIQSRKIHKQNAPLLIGAKHDSSFHVKKCFHTQKCTDRCAKQPLFCYFL